jgi:hypothetical protein
MARKKDDKMTYQNFGRFRHTWIHEADRIVVSCEEFIVQPPEISPQSARHWRRAAKLYERSADFYRRAGLGVAAIGSWKSAEFCYASLRMADDSERCRLKSVSIPVYYEED